jgi:hypothetical protein
MSSQRRSGKRANQAKDEKPVVHDLKNAYIIPAEAGDKMIQVLGELPSKYFEGAVGPMINTLRAAFRGDMKVTVDPNKQPPPLPAPPKDDPKENMEIKKGKE